MSHSQDSDNVMLTVYKKGHLATDVRHENMFQRCEIFTPNSTRIMDAKIDLGAILSEWEDGIIEDNASLIVVRRQAKNISCSLKATLKDIRTRLYIYIAVDCGLHIARYESDYPISSSLNIGPALNEILECVILKVKQDLTVNLFYEICDEIDIGMHKLNTTYWK